MNKYLKGFLLTILTVFLILISAPFFGWFHDRFIESVSGSWIGDSSDWGFIIGLFYGYVFFVSLMLTIFGKRFKYLLICFFVGIDFFIFWGSWTIIVDLTVAIIAVALGELILFSYKKFKKNKLVK